MTFPLNTHGIITRDIKPGQLLYNYSSNDIHYVFANHEDLFHTELNEHHVRLLYLSKKHLFDREHVAKT